MQNILLGLCLSLLPFISNSQCVVPTLTDSCDGNEPLALPNESIGSGTKKYYYGATATFGELRLNGGTLVVCGDLTVDRFYMDSGTIVVRPGARFVVGNGLGFGVVLRGNSAIHNFGRFEMLRNLSLDNGYASASTPNFVYNAPGSFFGMANQYLVINNPHSYFVNYGSSQFHGIITDVLAAPGSVCLGYNSRTRMTVMYNRSRNSYTSRGGEACLNVTDFTQLFDTLTNSHAINLCLGPTHRMDSSCLPWGCRPNAWGTPNRFQACNSCDELVLLPMKLHSFRGTVRGNDHLVSIELEGGSSPYQLYVQQMTAGNSFISVDSVSVEAGSPRRLLQRKVSGIGQVTYRLMMLDKFTGQRSYSQQVVLKSEHYPEVKLHPNPFAHYIDISGVSNLPGRVELIDRLGRSWKLTAQPGTPGRFMIPANAGTGQFVLKLWFAHGAEIFNLYRVQH